MTAKKKIFDSETVAPDAELRRREQTLVGFARRYSRVHDQLALLLNTNHLAAWSKKYHGSHIAIIDRVADQYPLVIFYGDVGTGKTAIAECIANRLLTESGQEDSIIFRLSNQVRGGGMVGEMGTLLSEAFDQVKAAVGKARRAVLIIDEADSIAASRSQDHSHHEDKVAVNTLIQGVDDLRRYKGRIAVILCTNRLSVVDPALQRRAAIIEEFARPDAAERSALLEMDLDGLSLSDKEILTLVTLTGAKGTSSGWTYSDFRTRLYPAALARAFPDRALDYNDLHAAAIDIKPSIVMEDH